MAESFWQSTCSDLLQGREPGWEAVSDYRQPLLILVRARFGWLSPDEQEDLVQDILLEIKARLFERYNPERGRFRSFLCGVVRNKAYERWRRRKRFVGLEGQEPGVLHPKEGAAVDLCAEVLAALRRWHRAHGAPADRTRVYVLAARLIHRETYDTIASREGLSRDAVKRILSDARLDILADLLSRTVTLAESDAQLVDWRRAARVIREVFRKPRDQARLLEEEVDHPRLRQGLEDWLAVYGQGMRELPGAASAEGTDLCRGVADIFDVDDL